MSKGMTPEEKKLFEHFAELGKPANEVSGPLALMCRRTLEIESERDTLREQLRIRDKALDEAMTTLDNYKCPHCNHGGPCMKYQACEALATIESILVANESKKGNSNEI